MSMEWHINFQYHEAGSQSFQDVLAIYSVRHECNLWQEMAFVNNVTRIIE